MGKYKLILFALSFFKTVFISHSSPLSNLSKNGQEVVLKQLLTRNFKNYDIGLLEGSEDNLILPLNNPVVYYDVSHIGSMKSTGRKTAYVLSINTTSQLIDALDVLRQIGLLWSRSAFFVIISRIDDLEKLYRIYWEFGVFNATTLVKNGSSGVWRLIHSSKFFKGSECGKHVILEEVSSYETYEAIVSRKNFYHGCTVKVSNSRDFLPYPINNSTDGKSLGLWVKPYKTVFDHLNLMTDHDCLNISLQIAWLSNDRHMFFYLSSGYSDMYAAAGTRNDSWDNSVECSHIFFIDPGFWVVPVPKQIPRVAIFFHAFNLYIWLILLATTTFVSLIVYTMSVVARDPLFSKFEIALKQTFSISLSMTSHIWPKSFSVSFILIMYVVYSLHITSMYQGRISSILTKPLYEKGISSLEELIDSGLPFICNEFNLRQMVVHDDYRISKIFASRAVLRNVSGVGRLMEILRYQNGSTTTLRTLYDFIGGPMTKLKVFPMQGFAPLRFNYVLKAGLGFFDDFNDALLRLIEGGFYWKWLSEGKIYPVESDDGSKIVLTLQHLQGAFVIYFIGLVTASFVFCIEVILK